MADDPRVEALLEELLNSGGDAEEICRECPELLPQVRAGWRRMREIETELCALFPDSGSPDNCPSALSAIELPRIKGHEVQAVLGRGGMGVVYKAWHPGLKRAVAVKMLLAGDYARPQELERFLREAQAVAGLCHPNIVQVYEVGNVAGRPYFTMELVDGDSLAERFTATPQPARQAAALVCTIAKAIQVAHQSGIIHRDLTPTNILLTADGTPKITDFGLARRMEGGGGLTLSGAAIGTPNYMAPEQALGRRDAIGPGTDVYALGVILYQLVTGRPPFRAETAAATLQQVANDDPVPPSRLNCKVPRDLETICLKCLHKEPQRRYASAAALADDLHRFELGNPISARPLGLMERGLRLLRKRPALKAAVPASLLLALSLVVVTLWWRTAQSAAVQAAVEEDLREAERLQQSCDYVNAIAVLSRAEFRLRNQSSTELHNRLALASHNLQLATTLDAIRIDRLWVKDATNPPNAGEWTSKSSPITRRYEDVFRAEAVGILQDTPAAVAARVVGSPARTALVAALDDWAVGASNQNDRAWALEVARLADPDTWRDRVRDPATWESPARLNKLAASAQIAKQPPEVLVALGERLRESGGDAAEFLMGVVLAHPADFWANVEMGNALARTAPREASSYYRTALATRPETAVVHGGLGVLYYNQGRLVEAMDHLEHAVRLAPSESWSHNNLGIALSAQGQRDAALFHLREAVRLDPDIVRPHRNLALALESQGQLDAAVDEYRNAHRLDPNYNEAKWDLQRLLLLMGRGAEWRLAWQKELATNPPEHEPWFGYAELCLFLGENDEYRRARRDLLAHFGATTDAPISERTGRACLLAPGTADELRQAADLADRAFDCHDPKYRTIYKYFRFAKGLAEYRRGRFESAIAILNLGGEKFKAPYPRLVLAMAQHKAGQKSRALKTLGEAVASFDWSAQKATNRDPAWISHVLRREAEAMMLPFLPAFLEKKYQPQNTDERLALLGVCQYKDLRCAEAGLYAAAFSADPRLARSLQPGRFLPAARAAVVAGCGGGADGANLSEEEQARWRQQARAWLRADLEKGTRTLKSGSPGDRALIQPTLELWLADHDLAGLREPEALDRLRPDERQNCQALWSEVNALLQAAVNRNPDIRRVVQ
jgi:serine/threonine protein kinase/tetratricopeptide (TPR) repeat protein